MSAPIAVSVGATSWRVGLPWRMWRQRQAAERAMIAAGWPSSMPLAVYSVGSAPCGRIVWQADVTR